MYLTQEEAAQKAWSWLLQYLTEQYEKSQDVTPRLVSNASKGRGVISPLTLEDAREAA